MKVIRKNIFETNSSSSHSISINGEDSYFKNKESVDTIYIVYGEYGWGYNKLGNSRDKLSYVATMIAECYDDKYLNWLKELVKEQTNANLNIGELNGVYEKGYIDHQSQDILDKYFVNNKEKFKENMRELIFNYKYSIIIDNDNH